jgi:hypothetical protein
MFQKREITTDMWLAGFIFLVIFWVFISIGLIKKGEWEKCFIFTCKCILTIPIMLWVDTMGLWMGAIVSTAWGIFLCDDI